MAPAKKAKTSKENLEQQAVLQAVVVADRFDSRFRPITDERPLALFPLVNRPILAYTLDYLAAHGVQIIYVYCCQHAQLVKDYIVKSKWNSRSSTQCQVEVIMASDAASLGDVLRDIDQKALFETDFLLVPGDLVSNLSFEKALAEHQQRREKDKSKPLMTLLLRNSSPSHVERVPDDDVIVALNSDTQQVLFYQKVSSLDQSRVKVPSSMLLQADCAKFDFRYDLSDTGVAICSPQVPQLFTDNFDYQTKEDFVRGILINEEFLGNQIHVHTTVKDFACRVSNFHMYDAVSRAILSRWAYPLVPDNDLNSFPLAVEPDSEQPCEEDAVYCHLRQNVYVGQVKAMGKNNRIENSSIIGHDVTVGNNCHIMNSVIGCGCRIGDDVTIRDSYLWHGVVVGNGCNLEKAFVCDEVVIYEQCKLAERCILASKVKLGPDVALQEDSVIYNRLEDEAFGDAPTEVKVEYDQSQVGSKGRGQLWSCKEDADSDDGMEGVIKEVWGMSLYDHRRRGSVGSESTSTERSDLSEEVDGMMDDKDDGEDNVLSIFSGEVKDSMTRAVEENVSSDNLVLEINSSKYAHNVTILDVMRGVTQSAFEIAFMKTGQACSFVASLKKIMNYLSPVFKNYNKSAQAQMECLNEIENYCLQNKHASDSLIKILMMLYEDDVLAEEVILLWHSKPPREVPDFPAHITPKALRLSVEKFTDWLQEAEEESTDEES